MKKTNIIYIAAAILAFSSCNDFLDKGPLDTFTNDNFWTNESNVTGYANTFYQKFLGYGNGSGTGLFIFEHFRMTKQAEVLPTGHSKTYRQVVPTGGMGGLRSDAQISCLKMWTKLI